MKISMKNKNKIATDNKSDGKEYSYAYAKEKLKKPLHD